MKNRSDPWGVTTRAKKREMGAEEEERERGHVWRRRELKVGATGGGRGFRSSPEIRYKSIQ